jgi:GTP-binding protein LepA
VSRSLATCQGALLLVDSSQRIQAQTLANYEKARALGLKIVPVVTKIDLPNAQPEEAALNMGTTFDLDPEDCIMTSAKRNIGILDVIKAVVERVPSPEASCQDARGPFLGRIVDSWFDECRGVVCLIQVVGGALRENDRITTYASKLDSKDIDSRTEFGVQEIGILTPKSIRTKILRTGQVQLCKPVYFVYLRGKSEVLFYLCIVCIPLGGLYDCWDAIDATGAHRRHSLHSRAVDWKQCREQPREQQQ